MWSVFTDLYVFFFYVNPYMNECGHGVIFKILLTTDVYLTFCSLVCTPDEAGCQRHRQILVLITLSVVG